MAEQSHGTEEAINVQVFVVSATQVFTISYITSNITLPAPLYILLLVPKPMLLQSSLSTAMPKRRKSTKSKKKDQGGTDGKNELGGEQSKHVAEHKSEAGEEKHKDAHGEAKQKDAHGEKWASGDEDKDWQWSDGELDDERLQAFFDKRPVT